MKNLKRSQNSIFYIFSNLLAICFFFNFGENINILERTYFGKHLFWIIPTKLAKISYRSFKSVESLLYCNCCILLFR